MYEKVWNIGLFWIVIWWARSKLPNPISLSGNHEDSRGLSLADDVTWALNFVHLTESRRVLRNRKTTKGIHINFSIFCVQFKEINGHEFLFDQLQLCGPKISTMRGILPERLPTKSLSGLLQRPEARPLVPAWVDLPPAVGLRRPTLLIVPGSGTARCCNFTARSRFTHSRTLDPSPRTKPSLRLGNSKPSACVRSDSH